MSEFVIGVDLGQSHDPTAIAVVRKLRPRVGDPDLSSRASRAVAAANAVS